MDAMPKRFPPEFKADVVRVARRGDLSIAEVAADFDISVESVKRWKRQADIDEGIPVTATCGVLGFSTQAFYQWQADPICDRDLDDAHLTNAIIDIHADDPEFG